MSGPKLPPIPRPPLPPPPRKRDTFTTESPTPTRSQTLLIYSSLLGVFDEMTPDQRMRFVDFAAAWKLLDDEAQERLLHAAIDSVFR